MSTIDLLTVADEKRVVVPQICRKHAHDLAVTRLKIPPTGPWKSALLTAQLLLFGWMLGDRRVFSRTGGDPEKLSILLNAIGCLACYDQTAYARVYRLMRKHGIDGADAIARGKFDDPDWPIRERQQALKRELME